MDVVRLDAKTRTPGKGPARAARRADEVPCILYGHSQEPVIFQVGETSLHPLIFTNQFHRVEVALGKDKWDCILKQVDFHPISDRPIHADFQILQAGEMITVSVPVQYTGMSAGQREGGVTQVFAHEVEISCLPRHIPDHVELDVSDVEIGDSLHIEHLSVENVTFSAPPNTPLFAVVAPRVEEVEEVEEELGLEGEEGVEDEEASADSEE